MLKCHRGCNIGIGWTERLSNKNELIDSTAMSRQLKIQSTLGCITGSILERAPAKHNLISFRCQHKNPQLKCPLVWDKYYYDLLNSRYKHQ